GAKLDKSQSPSAEDASVAVDFDIALCGRRSDNGENECIYASQSLQDTVEGFDIRLPRDYELWSLYVIAPVEGEEPWNWSPCPTVDLFGREQLTESVGLSIRLGEP